MKRILTTVLILGLLFSFCAAILPAQAQVDPWYNASWTYRKQLACNNTASTENLLNFPVLVHLDDTNIDWTKVQNSGQDIRFTDSDGETLLKHEIEEWDDTNTTDIWVKVPQIDLGSDTDHIWMYYGNDSAADGQDVVGTWNENYICVYHMNDNPDSAHVADSTSNGNNGDKFAADEPIEVASSISKGQEFDGSNDYINCGNDTSLDFVDGITIEVWLEPDTIARNQFIVIKPSAATWTSPYADWALWSVNDDAAFWINDYTNSIQVADVLVQDTWIQIVGTYNKQHQRIYVDGEFGNSSELTSVINTNNRNLAIGNRNTDSPNASDSVDGIVDEVRISDIARSGEWIEAQYLSMTGAFITFGSEESVPANPPTDFTLAAVNDNQVDITWVKDAGATNTSIRRKIGEYPVDRTDGVQVYYGSVESYSDTADEIGLELDKSVYYYRAWGETTLGDWSTDYAEDNIGGESMAFLAIFALTGILTFAAFRLRTNYLVGIAAAISWVFVFAYTRENPIPGVTVGTFMDSLIIFLSWGMAIALLVLPLYANKQTKDLTSRGYAVSDTGHIAGSEKVSEEPDAEEEYRRKVRRVLHPRRRR